MREEESSFITLWILWRKHARKSDGRGKARPTYFKWLAEGVDPADIYDGVTYHLRTMTDKDRPYIQLLSVYLNSEKWADECEEERAYQRRMAERAQPNVVQMRQAPKTRFLQEYEKKAAAE